MSTWFRRVWHLINRSRRERDLVREMHDHREAMPDPSTFGDTHRLIEQSRDAWANDARGVEDAGVQRDGVGQLAASDHLHDERLARWHIHDLHDAIQRCDDIGQI